MVLLKQEVFADAGVERLDRIRLPGRNDHDPFAVFSSSLARGEGRLGQSLPSQRRTIVPLALRLHKQSPPTAPDPSQKRPQGCRKRRPVSLCPPTHPLRERLAISCTGSSAIHLSTSSARGLDNSSSVPGWFAIAFRQMASSALSSDGSTLPGPHEVAFLYPAEHFAEIVALERRLAAQKAVQGGAK